MRICFCSYSRGMKGKFGRPSLQSSAALESRCRRPPRSCSPSAPRLIEGPRHSPLPFPTVWSASLPFSATARVSEMRPWVCNALVAVLVAVVAARACAAGYVSAVFNQVCSRPSVVLVFSKHCFLFRVLRCLLI